MALYDVCNDFSLDLCDSDHLPDLGEFTTLDIEIGTVYFDQYDEAVYLKSLMQTDLTGINLEYYLD